MKISAQHFPLKSILFFVALMLVDRTFSQNLIVNGDFSGGNSGFTTTNTYCNTQSCLNPYVYNAYAVGTNAQFFHSLFTGTDHTTGTGNFMIVNGGLFADIVWSQNVIVTSNSSYSFSAWVSTIYTSNTAALGFSINGVSQGTIAAPASVNSWIPFSKIWFSGSASTALIEIRALNTDVSVSNNGIDFGLDDLKLSLINTTSVLVTDQIDFDIHIYPNPTTDKILIATNGQYNVSLRDAYGREILQSRFHDSGEIDLKEYQTGVYFLVVTANNHSKCIKVIKSN